MQISEGPSLQHHPVKTIKQFYGILDFLYFSLYTLSKCCNLRIIHSTLLRESKVVVEAQRASHASHGQEDRGGIEDIVSASLLVDELPVRPL